MEYWPVVHKKYPAKVSAELRETLLEFTLECLLEQPRQLHHFAKDYFEKLIENETTKIEYDLDDSEGSAVDQGTPPEDPDYPEGYTHSRGRVIYTEPYNPEKDTSDDGSYAVYEKTDEQRILLKKMIGNSVLFRALDEEQVNKVIDVMFPQEVEEGDIVIKQYDDGDKLYVIEYGLFDVFIASEPNAEPVHVFNYNNSGTFGELALMYNMPRAATIKARTIGKLWAMDRTTFRKIVLKAAFKKRKMYEELISKVPILAKITQYEKMVLADALIPKYVDEGDVIIEQGDEANGMYFIESGRVNCTVYVQDLGQHVHVATLADGAYFGELALITHKPRAATVTALEYTKLAFLDVETFERILGPCVDIMERNIETYTAVLHSATEKMKSRSKILS